VSLDFNDLSSAGSAFQTADEIRALLVIV